MEKTRDRSLFILVTGIIVLGFALGLAPTAISRPLKTIQHTQEIRICIAPIHPATATVEPVGCTENCQFGGPAYELAMAFAATLGPEIQEKVIRIDWDQQFHNQAGKTVQDADYIPHLLASGICDVYPNNITKIGWRLRKVGWVPLFPSRRLVITQNQKTPPIVGPSDLAGKVTAVEINTSYHHWINKQNQTTFQNNPIRIKHMPLTQALEAVDTNHVDFVVVDADAAIWSIYHRLRHSKVAFPVGEQEEIGWAFHPEHKELQQRVTQFFNREKANAHSSLNRIWEVHFGMSLTTFITFIQFSR